jgi:hypothetical protein
MSSAQSKRGPRVGLVGLSLMVTAAFAQGFLVVSFSNDVQPESIIGVTDGFGQPLLDEDVHPHQDGSTWWIPIRSTVSFARLFQTTVIILTDQGRAVVTPSSAFTDVDWNQKRVFLLPLTLR